jgi:BRCT domain type II-containing protein
MAAILEIDLDGKPERELKELIEGNDEAEEILAEAIVAGREGDIDKVIASFGVEAMRTKESAAPAKPKAKAKKAKKAKAKVRKAPKGTEQLTGNLTLEDLAKAVAKETKKQAA